MLLTLNSANDDAMVEAQAVLTSSSRSSAHEARFLAKMSFGIPDIAVRDRESGQTNKQCVLGQDAGVHAMRLREECVHACTTATDTKVCRSVRLSASIVHPAYTSVTNAAKRYNFPTLSLVRPIPHERASRSPRSWLPNGGSADAVTAASAEAAVVSVPTSLERLRRG